MTSPIRKEFNKITSLSRNTHGELKKQIESGITLQKVVKSDFTRIPSRKYQTKPILLAAQELQEWVIVEKKLQNFLGQDGSHYLVFGGTGDLMLVLSACWNVPNSKVVFCANNQSKSFSQNFLDYFNCKSLILNNYMGTRIANKIAGFMEDKPNFKTSGHLADNLYYEDWRLSFNKYKQRIITNPNWNNHIGYDPFFKSQKTVVICPSGSFRHHHRQRYLEPKEFSDLCISELNKGQIVVGSGSMQDYDFYNGVNHENFYWLSHDQLIKNKTPVKNLKFDGFLKVINSASKVISVDTWMKTFSCLSQIETIVIKTRTNKVWQNFGVACDNYIFINENLWPTMKLMSLDQI